jgi:hypothetical protein
MSSRNVSFDRRFWQNGRIVGETFSLVSSGGNQVARGDFTPHNYSLDLANEFIGLYESYNCLYGSPSWGTIKVTNVDPKPSFGAEDQYRLLGQLQEQYDNGDFNAAIFVGELGNAVDTVASRAIQVAKAALAVKNGRFDKAVGILGGRDLLMERERKAKKFARSRKLWGKPDPKSGLDFRRPQDGQRVSDAWLELQYGWKPLLSDIYSMSDTIANLDKPRKRRIRVARTKRYKARMSALQNSVFATGGGSVGRQIIAYVEEDRPNLSQSLGLTNPELVAWELVPFSFVADWFIPIGGYLEARAFAQRAKGTFITTDRDRFTGRFLSSKSACSPGYAGDKPIKMILQPWTKRISLRRTVSTSLSVPLPTWKNGLGAGNRLANAVALVTSIFVKRS